MPKTARYALIWSSTREVYELYVRDQGNVPLLRGDGEAWYQWLSVHNSFSFQGQSGRLNLLKEARKSGGEGYWYAYRSQGGRTAKRYVGRTADLTVARLEKTRQELDGVSIENDEHAGEEASLAPQEHEESSTFSQEPLLIPKFHLPRLHPSLLQRDRLLSLLDQGLEHRLTLVSAEAGSGKTTLLSQWIATRSEHQQIPPVAWVSLDASDNDPGRFWRYIMTACQTFQADLAQSALALLHTRPQPPFEPSSLRTALTELLNTLAQCSQRGILVLEDYHVITSPQIHETIMFFLDHLPATVHMIMSTRSDPPFPLARLRARNDLFEVRAPDLRFSQEETAILLRQSIASPLSGETIRHLHEHLEGWVAGLHLIKLVLQRQTTPAEIEQALTIFAGNHHSFQEYFVTEVLSTQPEALQRFLLETSVLGRLTGSLCNAVTERQDSEHFLAVLERANLFLEPLDSAGQWYRYHALFAEAMRAEARRRLGEERLHALSSHASCWYEAHGMQAEAVDAALYAQDYARAAVLIEQYSETRQIDEYHTLHHWLEQMPEAVLRRHPVLCLLSAATLLFVGVSWRPSQFTLASLAKLLDMAERSFRAENNLPKLGEVFAFRALLAWWQDATAQSALYARQALHWLPEEQQAWRGLSLSIVGKVELLHQGQLMRARATLLEAYSLCEAVDNQYFKRATTILLARVFFEQGELQRAAEYYRQALSEARERGHSDDIGYALLGLAHISYQWNELVMVRQQAQEMLELGQYFAIEAHEVHATLLLIHVLHAQGQTEVAQQRLAVLLSKMLASLPHDSSQLYRAVLTMQARLALAAGDLATVQRWINGRDQHKDAQPLFPYDYEQEELLVARWLLAQGKHEEALHMLERLLDTAQKAGHIHHALELRAVFVLAYAARKQMPEARQMLKELLPQALAGNYLRLFLDAGEEMAAVLRSLVPHLREKTQLAYLQTILRTFSLEGRPPSLAEPLSPQERRVLRLLAANCSNAEIARELVVSVNTIRTQVQSIYRKLDVHNRNAATEIARRLQLL